MAEEQKLQLHSVCCNFNYDCDRSKAGVMESDTRISISVAGYPV